MNEVNGIKLVVIMIHDEQGKSIAWIDMRVRKVR